jgi:hypothetical protein
MITNIGKQLIAKFLLGQAPSYATHIAIGCGSSPLTAITFNVTNVALSGTTVTLTTSAAHNFTTSDYITIKDVGPFFDGVYAVASVPSTTTLTYTLASAPVTASTVNLTGTLGTAAGLITSVSDVSKLYVGQEIQKVSGAGTYSANPIILAITGTTLTLSVGNTGTTGAITFQSNAIMNIGVSPTGTVTKNYSNKTSLDFETFRTPIVSRGYVVENGVSKLVLTAELPTEERYEISEIGIFPSNTNPSAISNYSRNIVTFASTETWQYWNGSTSAPITAIATRLDDPATGTIYDTNGTVFQANADNTTFASDLRNARQERPRFLNNTYFIRADQSPTLTVSNVASGSGTATITTSSAHGLIAANLANSNVGNVVVLTNISANASLNGTYVITGVPSTTTFTVASALTISTTSSTGQAWAVSPTTMPGIQLTTSLDLSTFAATDEIRLALSVVDKAVSGTSTPVDVKFAIQFKDSLGNTATAVNVPTAGRFSSTSRYAVLTSQIQNFYKTGNFDWSSITMVSLYSNIGTSGSSYYVAYDAIRIENVTTQNSLYGLTGYTPILNTFVTGGTTYGKTIVKDPNVSNLIEFRYTMGVS